MRTVLIVAVAIAFCAFISVARAQDDLADYPIKVRCTRAPGARDCGQLTRAAGGAMRELRGVSDGVREEGAFAASHSSRSLRSIYSERTLGLNVFAAAPQQAVH
jgi:hypothetical protein